MTRILAKSTSEHGTTTKIGASDGCGGNTVPLVPERGYDYQGFGDHLRNVGIDPLRETLAGARSFAP